MFQDRTGGPEYFGSGAFVDGVLSTLDAQVRALAVCRVPKNVQMALGPLDTPLVHYVLDGAGWLAVRDARIELVSGMFIVVPKNAVHVLSIKKEKGRRINGLDTCEATPDGLLAIGKNDGAALRTACATVSADYWNALGFFDGIEAPLVFAPGDVRGLPSIFGEMLKETAAAQLGARAIASALLKKALVKPI